jgi:inorganic triphosphatase YgiF
MFSSKLITVLSAKDLKPLISRDFNRTLQQVLAGKDNLMDKTPWIYNKH